MSQKFEKIFKEALQNQEAPYSPQAWDALSSSLDKTMPVAGKKPFGPKAAMILAVGIIGAASAWYFAPSSTEPTERDANTANAEVQNKNTNVSENAEAKTETQTANKDNTDSDYTLDLKTNTPTSNVAQDGSASSATVVGPGNTKAKNSSDKTQTISGLPKLDPSTITSPNPIYKLKGDGPITTFNAELPQVDNICQFTSKRIENSSDVRMYVEFPSGKQTIVDPKKSVKIEFEEAGGYRMYNAEGRENAFFVYDNSTIDFSVDNINTYKNGLPSKEVKLNTPVESAEWTSPTGNQYYTGPQANFIFFKKGTFTVNVKTTNAQGCTTTTSKIVTVNEDYNLLATSGFKPNDLDPTVNRFMPQSLKERATDFTLIIIDPKDGGTVYETSDAMAGWDGVDRRNGRPAKNGENYIWKVTVNNTYPGEKHDYKGIFTVILN